MAINPVVPVPGITSGGPKIEQGDQRVLAAVIRNDDRFLLCQRPERKRHGGLWEFPGGKVHDGESNLAAIRRELAEELMVETVAVGDVIYARRDPGSVFIIEFLAVSIRGQPQCVEHQAMAWVTWSDALTLPLAPSDRAFLLAVGDARRT